MLNSSAAARAQGIQWTRPYLVELCERIRHALEAWAGTPDAEAPDLEQAQADAAQLAASLETLNVPAAATLADSLQRALATVERPDAETATVLLESVAVLPDYLERLETGAPDLPEVLADFVGRTRSAAGLEPIAAAPAEGGLAALNDDECGDYEPLDAAGMRRQYQRALRDWLRDSRRVEPLLQFTQRLQAADELPVRRLGRVAEAVFAGLAGGQLKPGPEIQSHLAALDRLLHRLAESGADAVAHADDIATSLLADLEAAERGCPEIDRIVATTAPVAADAAEIERARSVLSGRNRELFTAIADAARGELNHAKDTLNEFLLGQEGGDIGGQAGVLRSVAESLGMLGLERLNERVARQADRLGELTADPENPALLDVARELLLVESELDEAVLYLGEAPSSDLLEGDGEHLPKAEHRRVMRQVIRESLDDLGQAKHLLDQVHRGQGEDDGVEQAERTLSRVAGVLFMAGQGEAAAMLEAAARGIGRSMREGDDADDGAGADHLESLAEALVVVEFYLDSLMRLDNRGVEYLHDARDRLIALGDLAAEDAGIEAVEPEAPEAEGLEPAAGELQSAEPAFPEGESGPFSFGASDEPSETAGEAADDEPETIEFESVPLPEEPPSEEPAAAAETIEFDRGAESETGAGGGLPADDAQRPADGDLEPPSEAAEPRQPAGGASAAGDDFDLTSIFLEEFDEELAALRERLPRWREHPSDTATLAEIRRSFHTLKGSGRMAGADRIGDFAWQVEQVLNQTLEGQHRSEEVAGLTAEAIDALPSLRARLVGESGAWDDDRIDALAERMRALGDSAELPELDGLDPTLIQLMIKEIGDHLESVDRWIETSRDNAWPATVDRDLIRSVHTIKGTLRLAPIGDEAESMQVIEEYLQEVVDTEAPPDPAAVDLMEDLRTMLGKRLARLQREAVSTSHFDTGELAAEARRLISGLHHGAAGGERAAPEPDLGDSGLGVEEVPELEAESSHFDERLAGSGASADAETEAAELEEAEAEESEAEESEAEELEAEELEAEELEAEEPEAEELEAEEAGAEEVGAEEAGAEEAGAEETEAEEPEAEEPEAEEPEAEEPEAEAAGEAPWAATASPSAEPEPPAAADDTIEIDYPALDEELLQLFVDEARELLDHSDELLQQWRETPKDRQLVTALQRDIHTVKGSARMAGLNPIGEVAHVLEDLLENIAAGRQQATPASIETLESGCDHLHAMLEAVAERRPLPAQASAEPLEPAAEEFVPSQPPETADEETVAVAGDATVVRAGGAIRLTGDQIEELLNFAGEVSIFRSRIEQEIGAFRGNVGEAEQTISRLREQLRQLEQETEAQILSRYEREHGMPDSTFDPLELDRYSTIQQLSRALAESVSDLNSLTELLDDAGRQSETLLMQQARVNTELQEGLMQARMVSFNTVAPRLRRVVRNAARDAGRKADLRIEFEGEGELDRNVLDRVTAPIEHILRNAVAHGIETPEDRRAEGKPETGAIVVTIDREATELVIRVADDGAGLDLDRIRARALEMDLLTEAQADDPEQLKQVIFRTGFSTAGELSELAGRGVGMDVVSNEVRQIGGRISLDTRPGEGTRLTLRIPLSLAVMQAIFVEAGERLFAIPLQAVRGVARIQPAEWREALDGGGTYRYGGDDYPLIELESQLGFEPLPLGESSLSLLMVETGEARAAIRVGDIEGHREIVLKPVGPQISSIQGILGGSIMADGQVVVILDVAPMIERALVEHRLPGMVDFETTETDEAEAKRAPLVMVVDDSITMRRVTARILEHRGLEVVTARDGVEAVDQLHERLPDLMLLDIEMPRMDGFELARHVREDARLAGIPIMMITSRSGDKHREHARSLGVDRYLIKPYQEANMVRNVFEMLGQPVPGDEE